MTKLRQEKFSCQKCVDHLMSLTELIATIVSNAGENEEQQENPEFGSSAPGAHGTEGKARRRRHSDRETDSVPQYSEEQMDAVRM